MTGLYGLYIQGTPESNCELSVRKLASQQGDVLDSIQDWWANDQHNAPANLNVLPGDFLGDPAGDTGWPIVWTALYLNQHAGTPQLSLTSDPAALERVTVTCDDPRGTSPTLVVYPAPEGAQSPNRRRSRLPRAPPTCRPVCRSRISRRRPAPPDQGFPTICAPSARKARRRASPAASSSRIPIGATPLSALQAHVTCIDSRADGIRLVAYPAQEGPTGPDAQTFDAPTGQQAVQGVYSRRGNDDVRLDCHYGDGEVGSLTVPDSAFPPALTLRTDPRNRWLYCDRAVQLTSPATLSLAAQIPNAPPPLSRAGSDRTLVLTVHPDYFPPGAYQLAATCVTSGSPPFAATPLTLSSSQIPLSQVGVAITGYRHNCNAYACALQVTLGAPLKVNTVFSVDIGGGGLFLNPSGGDSPQAAAKQGCQGPPLPSPYLADGNGNYTRYHVNVGPGGCTAGAVMIFGEAVAGAAKATITQPVTVPGLGQSTATFVLP